MQPNLGYLTSNLSDRVLHHTTPSPNMTPLLQSLRIDTDKSNARIDDLFRRLVLERKRGLPKGKKKKDDDDDGGFPQNYKKKSRHHLQAFFFCFFLNPTHPILVIANKPNNDAHAHASIAST